MNIFTKICKENTQASFLFPFNFLSGVGKDEFFKSQRGGKFIFALDPENRATALLIPSQRKTCNQGWTVIWYVVEKRR